MAIRYVDCDATGAGTGLSWEDAWVLPTLATGVTGADTVYIDGGPAGGVKVYEMPAFWTPQSGTGGNQPIFRISLEVGRNGHARFKYVGATPDADWFIYGANNFKLSGAGSIQGEMHFQLEGYKRVIGGCTTNFEIENVDGLPGGVVEAGTPFGLDFVVGMGGDIVEGFRMSRCRFLVDDLVDGNGAMGFGSDPDAPVDTNIVEYCTFYLARELGGGGDGYDCFSPSVKSGVTLRHNYHEWYEAAYVGFQHADGWQALGGKNMRAYGNTYVNCPNYCIYLEAFENFDDVLVYNNRGLYTDPTIASGTPLFIACGVSNSFTGDSISRVKIFNNTACNGGANCFVVTMNNITPGPIPCDFIDCEIKNNLSIDGHPSVINTTGATGIDVSANVGITNANAPIRFVSYVQFGGLSNDLHPTAANTQCVDQGVDLSAYFDTDFDGDLRTVPWTIGAFNPETLPPPTPGVRIITSQGFTLATQSNEPILTNT